MDDKFGAKKIIGIVISIVAIVIIIIASIFYALTDGIVNQVYNYVNSLVTSIQEIGVLKTIMRRVGMNTDAVTMMSVYVIDDETVKNLKNTLDAQINTETQGLTEVRLRKILLANKVSSSLSNTLVAVPVTEEEIIKNAKEKNEGIESIDDFKNNCKEVKNSEGIWPLEGRDNNYDLYYDSDIFFYFCDKNEIVGDNKQQWYLGAMGAIQLQTVGEEEGIENTLGEYSPAEFEILKTNYENDPSEENKAKLKAGYKQIDAENIELYTVSTTTKKVIYTSKQGEGEDLQEKIKEEKELENKIVVGTQQVSLIRDIDTTAYAIPIELMIDFLNVTGSGDFLEEFIDYSLDKTKVKINAYCTENSEITYSKKEYNIKEDFIVEIYDFVNTNDNGNDNFIAYKDLVFNRKYEGRNIGKITDIDKYDEINYNDKTENGRTYSVDYICKYLRTAYEPGSDYEFKPILVKETTIEEATAESWEMFTSEVSTWYGTSMSPSPSIKVEYDVPEGQATEEGYNAFTEDSLKNVIKTVNEKKIEKKYIYDKYYNELSSDEKKDKSVVKVEGSNANDIYDNILTIESNSDGTNINCEGLNVKTLGKIGMEDKGKENDNLGAGTASHYIYANYTKSNIKQFEGQTKRRTELLDTSNIGASSVTTENQMMNFLELLKNETGEIPEFIGSEGGFNRDGKVVMYGDIYSGQIGAGDLLLDNGAQMLFELLESTETTQGLVPVFKYLAFLYTGTDYGVTLEDIQALTLSNLPFTTAGSVSPFACTITREEFIKKAKEYKKDNATYQSKMAKYAGDFYDICTSMGVNPVITYAHACLETGYGRNTPYNNYFGMAIYNGQSSGKRYSKPQDSIKDYCNWVKDNGTPGTSSYASNLNQASKWANYNSKLAGTPDNNIYALYCRYAFLGKLHFCNETNFDNPAGTNYYLSHGSTWAKGGRVYIYEMYEKGGMYTGKYKEMCGHKNANDPTTQQEQADYTVYTTDKRIKIAENIFGVSAVRVVDSSNAESGKNIVNIAQDTFNTLKREGKLNYNQSTGHTIQWPYKNSTIDCSSFVDIVMLRLGYTEFRGSQKNSDWWYNGSTVNEYARKYGWQIFYIEGPNDINKLQPGDIIAFNGYATGNYASGSKGSKNHIQIVDHVEGKKVIAWDCGYYPVQQKLGPDTKNNVYFWGYHKSQKGVRVIRVSTSANASSGNLSGSGSGSKVGETYIDNTGKVFKLYKQNSSDNKNVPYPGRGVRGATLGANGCGPTSCCIVSSGYGFKDTPKSLAASGKGYSSDVKIENYFKSRGFKTIRTVNLSNQQIKDYLNKGYKIVVRATAYANCGTYSLKKGQAHWYTFLGVNGNKVFVGDPLKVGGRLVRFEHVDTKKELYLRKKIIYEEDED